MPFTETEIVEVRLWYGKCAYGERNDINTDYLLKFLGTEATWAPGSVALPHLPPGGNIRVPVREY